MKSVWKELFLLFRLERRQLLAFSILFAVLLTIKYTIPYWYKPDRPSLEELESRITFVQKTDLAPVEYHPIEINSADTVDWMQLGFSRRQSEVIINYRTLSGGFTDLEHLEKVYILDSATIERLEPYLTVKTPFRDSKDPVLITERIEHSEIDFSGTLNLSRADSTEMAQFGLKTHQIRNVLSYRQKVAPIRSLRDVYSLYTFDSSLVSKLEPHLEFDLSDTPKREAEFVESVPININLCDSHQLVALKGIGPYYAKLIVDYREKLGGFYSIGQLYEIQKIPKSVWNSTGEYLTISDDQSLRTIDLNSDDFKLFLRHPYFQYHHVKKIFDYRDRNGKFTSLHDLKKVGFADPNFVDRVSPYLRIN